MKSFFICFFLITFFINFAKLDDSIIVRLTNLDYRQFNWIDTQISLILTTTNEVYRSTDEGQSWTNLNSELLLSGTSKPSFIYANTEDPTKIYIRGSGDVSWISNDKGENWRTVFPGRTYVNLAWHPNNSEWAIAQQRGTSSLYITKDFGMTWNLVKENVYQYTWGDAGIGTIPLERIYFIVDTESDDESPFSGIASRDFCQTDDFGASMQIVLQRSYAFVFLQNQIFVLVYLQKAGEFILKITPDVGSKMRMFREAEFPFGDELKNNGYSILDDSTGAVFLGVNHGEQDSHWGNIYESNSAGYKYVTSLQHVSQYYSLYDFGKIEGLEGIYIANVVENWEDASGDKLSDQLVTLMTWDNGASWDQLKPPHYDSNGQPIPCNGRCSLHLHGWSSFGSQFGPFYSNENSIGLIIATGNVGDSLSFDRANVNTYISRDAGLTWKELMKGVTIYEFGDHGGIIVLASFGESTTTLHYTLDEGTTPIQSFEFSNTAIDVQNIVIEPSAIGTRFILFGLNNNRGVVIGLDLSQLQPRLCDPEDYELWSPTNEEHTCLLGHNTTYSRKSASAKCFNKLTTEHIVSVVNCPCNEDDYECDFGYERPNSNINESCVLEGDAPTYPPEYCPEGEQYYKTKGYRLEAGNTCEGGVDHKQDGPFDCPPATDHKSGGKGWIAAAVLVPLVVIIIIIGIIALRSEKVREKLPFLKFANTWRTGYIGMSHPEEEDYIIGEVDDSAPTKEKEPEKEPEPIISIDDAEEGTFNPRG